MISTKGRYSIRVMIDLALHSGDSYIPVKEVAARQKISLKYLESILPLLTKGNLLVGIHGKGGGYRLCKNPEEISIFEILQATEGDLAPVGCLSCDAQSCDQAADCYTLPMWKKYYELIKDYFEHITLKDLMEQRI